jgi:GDP-4-dehydro-6-deoxy-D-mannose reductase
VLPLSSSDGDIASPDTFRKFLHEGIARVFHLAGKTYVPNSWIDPVAFYHTNVLGTANVAEYCRTIDTPLTFVSGYIYGDPTRSPISEDCPIRPNNPYALSKSLAENVCAFHSTQFGVPTVVIRPFNVYGVGQSKMFLIPLLIEQALHNAEIRVNDLKPKRDYVYIGDLIDAIMKTTDCRGPFHTYNIGSGASISVKEIIDIVQAEARTSKPIICNQTVRRNEILDVVSDISRAKNDLGWNPRVSFAQGIRYILQSEMSSDPGRIRECRD